MPAGQAVATFGVFPGTDIGVLTVTGQTAILSTSLVEAYLDPTAPDTADHSSDEHLVAQIDVRCSAIVAGVGFNVNLVSREEPNYGLWNIIFVWY